MLVVQNKCTNAIILIIYCIIDIISNVLYNFSNFKRHWLRFYQLNLITEKSEI